MDYEEKISFLDGDDFFDLFSKLGAAPRWVNSAGKRAIQLIGICHHGEGYSALFDPTTGKVNCFSQCGRGMFLHTWVMQALDMSSSREAKIFIEEWIDNKDINFAERRSSHIDFSFTKEKYVPKLIPPLDPMPNAVLRELYGHRFDSSLETLSKLIWSKPEGDGIKPEILRDFDVAYYPEHKSIILPHHNINGEIVGIYERHFKPTQREFHKKFPEIPMQELKDLPTAKYLPLKRDPEWVEDKKYSWSFPNSKNLYGLHKSKHEIKKQKIAIIFEGAKSVMLAHQYGYPYCVASHTFGANVNHISLLIEHGAKEIILAFDKQYQTIKDNDLEYALYRKKTYGLAEEIKDYVDVSCIQDVSNLIKYKDAPIDNGKQIFDLLYNNRRKLAINGKMVDPLFVEQSHELIIPRDLQRKKEQILKAEEEVLKNWRKVRYGTSFHGGTAGCYKLSFNPSEQ